MPKHVAFLRSINVGGNNRVPMAPLAAMFRDLGHSDVQTYIQSGNVVFRPGVEATDPALDLALEAAIQRTFTLSIRVVTRSHAELAAVLAHNPYPDCPPEQSMVVLLRAPPTPAQVANLDPQRSPPDVFTVHGREIYASCPNGFAKTKLGLDWFERKLGAVGTARNWRTVGVLAGMAAD